ncbi:MAG: MarR family transcriptional regulator [Mongoliitalea sp.]
MDAIETLAIVSNLHITYISIMGRIKLRHLESGIRFFLTQYNNEITSGEKVVLITIIRLIEEKEVVTKKEICEANRIKDNTTYAIIRSLESKGYVSSKRSNKHYSKSFLSLSFKGQFFSVLLKDFINSN